MNIQERLNFGFNKIIPKERTNESIRLESKLKALAIADTVVLM